MLKRIVNVVEVLALAGFVIFVLLLFTDQPASNSAAAPPSSSSSSSSSSGGGSNSSNSSNPSSSSGGGGQIDGAAIYDDKCSGCHGSKGQGAIGPKLNGGSVTKSFKNPADEVIVVKNGRGSMPSFGDQLSDEQIQAVVDFTRNGLQQR
ncbi:MAG TPA: cytochrome c [Acidimicrobiales bacterium]